LDLRYYQQEAVDSVYSYLREHDDNPCIVLPTAGGKSLVLAQIAKDAVQIWNGRVLILAHVKELLEQNADKIRKLCPEMPIGIYSAGLKSRQTEEPVIVAGIQSVYDKAAELGSFDLVIVDECFPAGTLIDTPRGPVPIDELYIGQPVCHALGVGEIEAISSRPVYELLEMELSNGKTIRCTPNHQFFTPNGWRKASTLGIGTYLYSHEDMFRLRKRVSSQNNHPKEERQGKETDRGRIRQAEMLLQGMPEQMATSAGHIEKLVAHAGEDSCQILPVLREGNTTEILPRKTDAGAFLEHDKVLFEILCKESREPDVFRCHQAEGLRKTEGTWTQAADSRRERETDAVTPEAPLGSVERGNGISGDHDRETTERRSIPLLQAGCGASVSPSGDSAGRIGAFMQESPQDRQADPELDGRIRVVSVAHLKFESPQTVFNLQVSGHPSYFADGVLVHNCHLIPPDGEGRYRTFIRDMKAINPIVRVIGLTATPYRLDGGAICRPNNILNAVCYEAGVKELLEKGYLCPLVSKETKHVVDTSSLHVRGGEFVESEAEKLMNDKTLIEQACAEIAGYAKDRHSVLVFCCSILHATEVMKELRNYSDSVEGVFGDTLPAFREERLDQFRAGNLKYLVNVGVLTTGFDAPNTDCVVLLRPTASPGLYYQMVGRGFRLSPTKTNTLVLDFGGNIVRHGPVDCIKIRSGRGDAGPAGKTCPHCQEVVPISARICRRCGYEFTPKEKNPEPNSQTITHDPHASSAGIISGQTSDEEYEVREVVFRVHQKRGAPPNAPKTMRVEYKINLFTSFSEWVCPEHRGFVRENFKKWWKEHAPGCAIPFSANDAVFLANEGAVRWPSHITVRTESGKKYPKVVGYRYPEMKPQPQTEQEEIPF